MLRFLRCAVAVCFLSPNTLYPQTAVHKPSKAGSGKPAARPTQSEEASYALSATGPFDTLRSRGICGAVDATTCPVTLLVNGKESGTDEAAAFQDGTHLLITYTTKIGALVPTDLRVGRTGKSIIVPYVAGTVTLGKVRQAMLVADFCLASPVETPLPAQTGHNEPSATAGQTPHPGTQPASSAQTQASPTASSQSSPARCGSNLFQADGQTRTGITGYVQGVDESDTVPLRTIDIDKTAANVTYEATADFHPVWLVLTAKAESSSLGANFKVPYNAAGATAGASAVYSIGDFAAFCGNASQTPCDSTTRLHAISFNPGVIGTIDVVAREGDLLFTRVQPYSGVMPPTISVMRDDTKKSVLARLLTQPGGEQSNLEVHLTVMDQETMRRNYGSGLAEAYLAIKLDMVNRTEKKLQFNKSAVWFDADFVQTTSKRHENLGNRVSDLTFDMPSANVYDSQFSVRSCPAVEKRKGKPLPNDQSQCKHYLFGIDQTQRFYADGPLSILGSFDYQTQRTDRILRVVELFGSVLTNLATGGAIAQVSNTAFRDATAVLTGTFLPGSRSIVMNTAELNRQRANLVAQTFQDTVQIAEHATVATIVLLPREPLIGIDGYERRVLLDRVLNVHIDPDVINGVKDPPVPAGKLTLGYTKAQVRQAVGEPQTLTTKADETSNFEYAQGPFQTVTFNKDGQVITWVPRSLTDQLDLSTTLAAAKQVLRTSGITGKELTLQDGSTILLDVPGVSSVEHYDSAGKRLGIYALLYDRINAGKGNTKLTFERLLGSMKLPTAVDQVSPSQAVGKKDVWTMYDMPDVKGGTMRVDYDGVLPTDKTKEGPRVKDIIFMGAKPGIQ